MLWSVPLHDVQPCSHSNIGRLRCRAWLSRWGSARPAGAHRTPYTYRPIGQTPAPGHGWEIYSIMYVLEWQTVSVFMRGLFWCLFPELWSNEGNKHQNNAQVSAETVRHESTYIILFVTWNNESVNDDRNDDLYTSSPCLTRSFFVLLMTTQSFADDSIMTRQLWRDHVNSDI